MSNELMINSNQATNFQLAYNLKKAVFAGEDYEKLAANAVTSSLRKDAWKMLDTEVISVATEKMPGIMDLMSMGLTVNNGGLGTLVHEYEAVSDMADADVTMDGVTDKNNDAVEFTLQGVPVPIIGKEFKISERKQMASANRGETIDTTQARISARKCSEKLENILFNGANKKVNGYDLYGYTNHPQRNQVTLLLNWGTTPANIPKDIQALLAAADAVKRYGPFVIYVSKTEMAALRQPISTTGDTLNTYLKAMLEMYGDVIVGIKMDYTLAAGNVVMVQMDKETIDLSIGQEITTIGMSKKFLQNSFLVFMAMAPRIKVDGDNTTGVFHGTV